MKYALVEGSNVYDVVDHTFEVTPNFTWIECPDDVKPYLWTYDGQTFTPIQETVIELQQPLSQGAQTL